MLHVDMKTKPWYQEPEERFQRCGKRRINIDVTSSTEVETTMCDSMF